MSELYRMQCGVCGIEYAIPEKMAQHAQNEGGFHHCPNGHSWGWPKDGSRVEKLRRERDRLQQRQAYLEERAETAERSAAAFKGQITKLKKRASAGVCPCCNRTFQNLQRHMKTQHPDFAEKPNLKVVGE